MRKREEPGRAVPHIVIVGGGYAGFYTAWGLEKRLRRGEAQVTLIDPLPYMTYQPFLPEVAAGSVEARHAVVSLRKHLKRTRVVSGRVSAIDHAQRRVRVELPDGQGYDQIYDELVVTAGAVTRTFPVPGVPETAIGLKRIEEAVAVRDALLTSFDRAAGIGPGPERARLLTVTFVGGGFAGVEGFGELLSLARSLTRHYPGIEPADVHFHLIEASGRILPEVDPKTGAWVARSLRERGAEVHLSQTVKAVDGTRVTLSGGEVIDSGLLVWTAGIAANPVVSRHSDLPLSPQGLVVVRPDLRVGPAEAPVEHAWAAGDDAAIPDLARGADAFTVPNAQHAVRQGRLLAKNLVRSLRNQPLRQYRHPSLGVVATLGLGQGVFQAGPITLKGFPAWVIHRGYHVLAVPTWERKIRVLLVWAGAAVLGRDIVSLESVQQPRYGFRNAGGVWVPESVAQIEDVGA